MSSLQTPRFELPLLAIGQAQKELYHNEAITLLDFLMHPVVQSIENDPASLLPAIGDCWIIGENPTDEWSADAGGIACWTDGGWRFLKPAEHMQVFVAQPVQMAMFIDDNWRLAASIANPDGGTIVDTEARAVIDSILLELQKFGMITL